ncbi:293_t:CDS:2 [Entrophospora sp. SA101]|nr:293_t:CDS:2 [Entrophospora sp. SA101]
MPNNIVNNTPELLEKINTSNEEVTHLEFVDDRASDYNYEIFPSCKNITLLEEFLELACKKQITAHSSSLKSFKIAYYSKLSDKNILSKLPDHTPTWNSESSETESNYHTAVEYDVHMRRIKE